MNIIRGLNYRFTRYVDLLLWKRDCNRYKNTDYFHYQELCSFHKLPDFSPYQFNVGYGNAQAIETLLGHKIDYYNDYLEHGLWYSENIGVLNWILELKKIGTIYTYSQFRKQIVENALKEGGYSNKVVAVGPYIRGAENFHTKEELKALKKKLGKVLLVLPMHSYPGVDNSYDTDSFLNEIERIKPQFDTVLVCLAYKDVQRGAYEHFKKKGYTLVSNGCPGDPHFLSRQRDLMELSDLTMSNGMGTHIGYSISLNRPHYFFYQKIESKVANPTAAELRELQCREELALKMSELFGKMSFEITGEQVEIIKKYWGLF